MNQPAHREVLECASPLALSDLVRERKSGRGLPQSKTLARQRPPRRGSWSQCMRKSERRLSMNTNSQTAFLLCALSACLEIGFQVAQATRLCRPATPGRNGNNDSR